MTWLTVTQLHTGTCWNCEMTEPSELLNGKFMKTETLNWANYLICNAHYFVCAGCCVQCESYYEYEIIG